jgi:glycosyltransferase involved in cell wall biosynthesis
MNDSRDLVSVIIPTFNRALICKRAVDSVLSQTHRNVEVIVVDDGSTDRTKEVICDLDKRVKYIWQPNAGVSAARNRGMDSAQGEFVAFLDDDDRWAPYKLEAQLSVFQHLPDVGMVWTDMRALDPQDTVLHHSYLHRMYHAYRFFEADRDFRTRRDLGEVWRSCPQALRGRGVYEGNIFSWMFMGSLVHTSTVILRRDRQTQVGHFDEDLAKSGEDYDFHFRTCRLGDVSYIDFPSVDYRVGATDQLSGREYWVWGAQNNLKTILKMLAVAADEIHLPPQLIRLRMAEAYGWAGTEEFYVTHRGRPNLYESLKYNPIQARILALLIFSFVPHSVFLAIRDMKRNAARICRKLLGRGGT